jgi:hypothetical protein
MSLKALESLRDLALDSAIHWGECRWPSIAETKCTCGADVEINAAYEQVRALVAELELMVPRSGDASCDECDADMKLIGTAEDCIDEAIAALQPSGDVVSVRRVMLLHVVNELTEYLYYCEGDDGADVKLLIKQLQSALTQPSTVSDGGEG